jgi:hypothetical protein
MSINIIQDKRNLHKFLKHGKISIPGAQYILCNGNEDSRKLLEKHGVSEITQKKVNGESRENILKEYVDLIGLISLECNSRTWWATNMASKNRETSQLSFLLHEFILIIESISRTDGRDLLIISPSWVLVDSLKTYLSKNNLEYQHFPDSFGIWKEIILTRAISALRVLHVLIRVNMRKVYFTLKLRNRLKELSRQKAYYVVKTFLYDHSFDGDGCYRDAFFGSLPNFLKQKEHVLILANIFGSVRLSAEKIQQCESHLILPLEVFLSFKGALRAVTEIVFTKVRIKQRLFFFGYDVTDVVNDELKRTRNGIDFYQFLHYWLTCRFLESVRAETFLLTYENNPWEKMCIMAIREFSPHTEIIGCQHTCVPQAAAKLFISKYEKDVIPIPDRILTVGKTAKEILKRYGSYDGVAIEPACGLRFEYLSELSKCERTRRGRILLAADGLYGTHKIVNYVVNELRGNMDYNVRIRTHPALPLERLKNALIHRLEDIPNFKVSQTISLKEDLEWADMLIYWGSTVSFEALSMGKPIIRYTTDSVLSNDPLFECGHLKWIVRDNTSLVNTIQEIYALDNDYFEKEVRQAREYIADFFFPVTEERLKLFLPSGKRNAA